MDEGRGSRGAPRASGARPLPPTRRSRASSCPTPLHPLTFASSPRRNGTPAPSPRIRIVTTAAAWSCPTCAAEVSTRYCPRCGESAPRAHDLTLRGLLQQTVEAFTSIDGRLLRSFRSLLVDPGGLTVAYVDGRRKPFVGPFQLFLIANVLFFATQSLTRSNVLSSPLASHLHDQDWAALARSLVADRLQRRHLALDAYAPMFDRAAVLNAKSLILLMVLPLALLLPAVFLRHRRPFVAHVVFSLHFYAFLLLLFSLSLVLIWLEERLGGAGMSSALMDTVMSTLILASCAAYLYAAIGRAYGVRGAARVATAVVLSIAIGAIVLGYRFAIFLVTLYST